MRQQSESGKPFQKLCFDILGPYPRSKKGLLGLLIVPVLSVGTIGNVR